MESRPEPPTESRATPEPVSAAEPVRPRRRRLWRVLRRTVFALAALVVGVLVAALSIDWGPTLRGRAEREASRLIERPMHIGKLSMSLLRGRFVLEDVRIEGLDAQDEPFLDARRLVVAMPWWAAVSPDPQ